MPINVPANIRIPEYYFTKLADVTIENVGNKIRAVDRHGNKIVEGTEHASIVQEAVDHVYDKYGGGVVYLGPGRYDFYRTKKVSSSADSWAAVVLRPNVEIIGSGIATKIYTHVDKTWVNAFNGPGDGSTVENVRICCMYFEPVMESGGYEGGGISLTSDNVTWKNILLEKLYFKNIKGWAISSAYVKNWSYRIILKDIIGEGLERGLAWFAKFDGVIADGLVGIDFVGKPTTDIIPGESSIIDIESGTGHLISNIYGYNVHQPIRLGGIIRAQVENVFAYLPSSTQDNLEVAGVSLMDTQAHLVNINVYGQNLGKGIYVKASSVVPDVVAKNVWIEGTIYGVYAEGTSDYHIRRLVIDGLFLKSSLSWSSGLQAGIYARYVDVLRVTGLRADPWNQTVIDVDYVDYARIEDGYINTDDWRLDYRLVFGSNVAEKIIERINYRGNYVTKEGKVTVTGDGSTTKFKIADLTDMPSFNGHRDVLAQVIAEKYTVTPLLSDDDNDGYVDTLYAVFSTAPASGETVNVYYKANIVF